MNLMNRLLVIVQLLIAIALMPILVVVLILYRPGIADAVNNLMGAIVGGPNAGLIQATCVGLAALIFIVAILMLFLELHRPATRRLSVQSVTEGQVELTSDAILHRLETALLQVPDVTHVQSHVVSASKGKVVNLLIELETSPEVNVPKKTQEVIATAKQVMEEQLGLQVGKVQVRVTHPHPKK